MRLLPKQFSDLVTFTRASGGTSFRPVGYGPNLVSNGDFSGGATGWILANGATVSGGALQLTAANATAISTSPNCIAGKTYRFEFDYVSGSGSAYINVQMGSAVFGAVTTTTPRRYSIVHRATATDSIKIWQDGGAAGSAVIDNIFVEEVILDRPGDPIQLFTSPTNTPRIDYDPVSGACKGLLIEEARTNLILWSESPANQSVSVTAQPYTLSFYGTGSVAMSGAYVGTLNGVGAFPARAILTFTPTAGSLALAFSGDVTKAQLE